MDKILIIQTAFLGDVVLATVLVENLRNRFPNAQIDFLLRKGNQSLLENHPHLRKVWILDKAKKWSSVFSISKALRKERYDLVINAQRFATSGILTLLSGGKIKVGFDKNPFSFLFSKRAKHQIGEGHEVDRNNLLIQKWVPNPSRKPKLYPRETLPQIDGLQESFVCMAPSSVWFTKTWPAEKWVGLINQLKNIQIVLLGGPSDQTLCDHIRQASQHEEVLVLAGKLSLLESARIISMAKMTYSNDSAPVHLASAMNAPIVEIFCSTVPSFGFGPLSENAHVAERKEALTCRPCGLHGHRACPEKHFKCADIDEKSLARIIFSYI